MRSMVEGRSAQSFSGPRRTSRPAPLPPRCCAAWSPFPASRGRKVCAEAAAFLPSAKRALRGTRKWCSVAPCPAV